MPIFSILVFSAILGQSNGELYAQRKEKQAELAEKEAEMAKVKAELDAVNAQIAALPGWDFGINALLGMDFSGNRQWYAIPNPNSKSNGATVGFGIQLNYDQPKYFWNNLFNANINRVVTQLVKDGEELESVNDALSISSLFGYKLSKKISLSAEAKYSSTVLNFNDPGKLVVGAGITYTPFANHFVSIHPLAYEKNWPGELISAPGAKLAAFYKRKIGEKIQWNSIFNAFASYSGGTMTLTGPNQSEEVELSAGELFNWTWINGFNTSLWKGIGFGLNIGLRQDRQIAARAYYNINEERIGNNPLQAYYTLGLSYSL